MSEESARKEMNSSGASRFHHLEALRGLALLLLVVLNVSAFLIPFFGFWPVTHPYVWEREFSANPYIYILSSVNGFSMPMFFMLSGFFTAIQWQGRGLRETGMSMVEHAGMPLLIGMVTIVPLTHWAFSGSDFNSISWPEHFYHLWVLWYLLLIVAWFAVAVKLGLRFLHPLWWLLVLLPAVPQYFMRQTLGADVPRDIMPDPAILVYYLICFLLGVFLHQRGVEARWWWSAALPLAILIMPLGLVFLYAGNFDLVDPAARWKPAAEAGLQVAYTWLACFGMMGLFSWVAGRDRLLPGSVSAASYWIYIGHLPLVIWGQTLAVDRSVNPHLAFVVICLLVPGILLAIFELGVRRTWIATGLIGKRLGDSPPGGQNDEGAPD